MRSRRLGLSMGCAAGLAGLLGCGTGMVEGGKNVEMMAVETPVFLPPANEYAGLLEVSIATSTSGATIFYTMGASPEEPAENSTIYTGPLTISETTAIAAKAFKAGMSPSATARASYVITSTDTTPPLVAISSPANGSTVATSTVTVSGTASDDVAVRKVEVRVGAGAWELASGTTSWSTQVTLLVGSNTIYAKATDTSGVAKEVSVKVSYCGATQCGNGEIDTGEACDTNDNIGCSSPTPICRYDCQACVVSAANNISIIDHVFYFNGVKTFPTFINYLCDADHDGQTVGGFYLGTCAEAIAMFSNVTVAIDYIGHSGDNNQSIFPENIELHEAAGMFWTNQYVSSGDPSPAFYSTYSNYPYFFGMRNKYNETTEWDNMTISHNNIHNSDKSPFGHPTIFSHFGNMANSALYGGDVASFNAYWHRDTTSDYEYQDWLHVTEGELFQNYIQSGCGSCENVDDIASDHTVIYEGFHTGVNWIEGTQTWIPYSDQESRAEAYHAAIVGAHGMGWDGYKIYIAWFPPNTPPVGMIRDKAAAANINSLAGEIKQLNHVLLSPVLGYSWGPEGTPNRNDTLVSFSNNPTKSIGYEYYNPHYRFSYRLYQHSSNSEVKYLIALNKDINQTTTDISILGLSGGMKATMLGTQTTGSSSEHKIIPIPVTGGIFTDTFDGYAVHIYEIAP